MSELLHGVEDQPYSAASGMTPTRVEARAHGLFPLLMATHLAFHMEDYSLVTR